MLTDTVDVNRRRLPLYVSRRSALLAEAVTTGVPTFASGISSTNERATTKARCKITESNKLVAEEPEKVKETKDWLATVGMGVGEPGAIEGVGNKLQMASKQSASLEQYVTNAYDGRAEGSAVG